MAVDTRNERAAVVSLAAPFMWPPALPDGSAERYGLAHLFYNEAGDTPTPTPTPTPAAPDYSTGRKRRRYSFELPDGTVISAWSIAELQALVDALPEPEIAREAKLLDEPPAVVEAEAFDPLPEFELSGNIGQLVDDGVASVDLLAVLAQARAARNKVRRRRAAALLLLNH